MSALFPPESLYKALVEASPDAFLFSDFSGTIRIANQQAARMGGFNGSEDLIGLNIFDFITPRDREHVSVNLEKLVKGLNKGTIEATLLRKDQTSYQAEITGSIIRDDQDQPVGLISITRDITDRKIMEETLLLARDNADKANHLKDAFISNISHEIRTPLNAIMGFTELIREEIEDSLPESTLGYFPIIDHSCQRLMHTVEMMLDLSKLQSGMFDPTRSLFDLDEQIRKAVALFQESAANKSIELTYDNYAGAVQLLSDEKCINQAVNTLLNNAVKYTSNGSVKVTLRRTGSQQLAIIVADTGIGMTPEYISRIFEPFSQEETSHTRNYDGIGLSLSIAKRLLHTIGATISVTSRRGEGSEFTISLPVN